MLGWGLPVLADMGTVVERKHSSSEGEKLWEFRKDIPN